MIYQLEYYPDNASALSGLWAKEFQNQMSQYNSPYLTHTYFHSQTLSEELMRNAQLVIPKFVVTFSVLIFFAIFSR